MARVGDFDQDGFVDLVLTVRDVDGESKVRVLRNVADKKVQGGRTFERVTCDSSIFSGGGACDLTDLDTKLGAYAGAFIDLQQRGGLDLIVLHRSPSKGTFGATAVLSAFNTGNMYLKASILNGVCWDWCKEGEQFPSKKPLGGIQHGGTWKYKMQDLNGEWRMLVVPQLASSSHMALMLPHVVMGLGATSYFIEVVYAGLPLSSSATAPPHYTAVQGAIPNSELIATPIDSDAKIWTVHAFVHPSEGILYVAGVLGVTLCVLAASIMMLQRREKYHDAMEKQLTAHAFI
mmetsp:Transcript_33895/g.66126  ORF Transcript_33895/g.66126 Transcript_33895/m.66126 type:complete len:290 (+) Transcript_33895:2-871(+)